jgi:hypothetical protein
MPLAKITGEGLFAIACAVLLLWVCLISEHVMLRKANAERVRVLREVEQLQRKTRPIPVSAPLPASLHRSFLTVG